ncbi:hypothetical protein FDUTEX481_04789 [Tolypothrix sp. PCC 7601]|nr:hypothetical protein FDUTEX481_04789 [Tolypothrix sp. PCC 7601]
MSGVLSIRFSLAETKRLVVTLLCKAFWATVDFKQHLVHNHK